MFVLRALANFADTFKIVRKDDKIISLKVSKKLVVGGSSSVSLTFIDSLLILPASLRDLGLAFDVEMKGDYDHMKTNFCQVRSDFEAIRAELLEYNKQDCLVLHQVINKFSELVFDRWTYRKHLRSVV